jgi:hypothetical protein
MVTYSRADGPEALMQLDRCLTPFDKARVLINAHRVAVGNTFVSLYVLPLHLHVTRWSIEASSNPVEGRA